MDEPGAQTRRERPRRPTARAARALASPAVRYAVAAIVGIAALAFAAVTTTVTFRDITLNQNRTRAAVDAAFAERAAFVALIDEETGVRGYVATGDRRFLEPFVAGRATYRRVHATLTALAGSEGDGTSAMRAMGDRLQAYFDTIVDDVTHGRRARALGSLLAGKAAFDALRREDAKTSATMQASIESARAQTRSAIELARNAIIATTIVLLIGGALAARLASASYASSTLARRDAMTNLPNRRAFEERLENVLAARADADRVGLLYVDLDSFKVVNDRLGHAAGDELLGACGARLRTAVRPADFVARIGGDEFAVIVRDAGGAAHLGAIRGRMLQELETPFAVAGETVRIGASIGIAMVPDDGDDAASVLRVADEAMYRAKRAART